MFFMFLLVFIVLEYFGLSLGMCLIFSKDNVKTLDIFSAVFRLDFKKLSELCDYEKARIIRNLLMIALIIFIVIKENAK